VGCDYFPTAAGNVVMASFHFAVIVSNASQSAASIKVTMGDETISTTTVAAADVAVIKLPWQDELKAEWSPSKLVVDGAYRLRSDRPVTVYQYSPLEYKMGPDFSFTNDASLLLPVNVWTGNYRVVARNHAGQMPGQYHVTASQDDTTVTLSPSASGNTVQAGGGVSADGTGTIVLNQGDVLAVKTASASGGPDLSDLTGTLIAADKPVQVIGGHECTFVPYNKAACDHLEESIYPLETLSNEYIVTAPLVRSGADTVPRARMVRVVATEPNTTVSYDPDQPGAPTTLVNAGDYFELEQSDANFEITASAKVIVAEYMLGQEAGIGDAGDPAMTLAVPVAQYRTNYLFHAPTSYEVNFLNIVAPTGSSVTLDGQAVTGFAAIGSSGFSAAQIELDSSGNGDHVIMAAKPIGINVYGYGQWTSYWYPGGLDLKPIAPPK